jgi:HEAT repeat protein
LEDKKKQDLWIGAAWSLGMMGPQAKDAVPALLRALDAEGVADGQRAVGIQSSVICALGQIGPDAKAAIPHLFAVLNDFRANLGLRIQAIHALKGIGPDAVPTPGHENLGLLTGKASRSSAFARLASQKCRFFC